MFQDLTEYDNVSPQVSRRTVSGVFRDKILDSLEGASLQGILKLFLGFIGACALTMLLMYTDTMIALLTSAIRFQSFLIVKFLFSAVLIWKWSTILSLISRLLPEKKKPLGENIEGIPTAELLDHLFQYKSFKRDDIEGKFGIPRNRFTALGDKLENMGILERGPNNSRVLNERYSRQDIAAILEGRKKAKELAPVLKKVDASTWTVEPTAEIIQERVATVKESLQVPSSPVFTLRPLRS